MQQRYNSRSRCQVKKWYGLIFVRRNFLFLPHGKNHIVFLLLPLVRGMDSNCFPNFESRLTGVINNPFRGKIAVSARLFFSVICSAEALISIVKMPRIQKRTTS